MRHTLLLLALFGTLVATAAPALRTVREPADSMHTEDARNILTVIYCFEKEIPLDELLCQAKAAFEKYAGAKDVEIGSV